MFNHDPVLPDAVLTHLAVKPDGVYADGTVGGAGHALSVAKMLTAGRLFGIDRDRRAIAAAEERLRGYADRFTAIQGDFRDLPRLLAERGAYALDGALLDLGVSSHQLDTAERGFSYRLDGRLDMRMDERDGLTAYEVVNGYSEKRLADIIFAYGEERFARRIARAVAAARPVETTRQLAALIERAVPSARHGGHPAKRTFQAIRIAVNDELSGLDAAARGIAALLKPGGRFCVITFHSLEDRIIKNCFASLAHPCQCPRELPRCVCGKRPLVTRVTRKPITPGAEETAANRRARSAKLRVVERVHDGKTP